MTLGRVNGARAHCLRVAQLSFLQRRAANAVRNAVSSVEVRWSFMECVWLEI